MAKSLHLLEEALGGRYRVARELGRGGMAVVYLAEDLRHHRRVAIKVLKPELAPAIGPERFLREIEIAARLAHPNILPLHDSGQAEGFLYYVMPYVEGETLRERLRRECQLPLHDALHIAREIADALGYAHSLGVVHRDIKPENILFQAGHAVVSDFGIARAISAAGENRLTETGIAVGTPAYMSPEQGTDEHALDGRSDIYSLGCVIYEMLAGAPPFTGPSAQAVLARHTLDPVPPLRTVRKSVPPRVECAVTRALEKVPADRFATALEFADALVEEGAPLPVTVIGTARSIAARRPWALVLGAGLVAGVAWWLVHLLGAGPTRIQSLAVLPLENISRDQGQEYFVAGIHDALIGELSRLGAVRLISRTSALRYRNSGKSVPEIARELDVDALVEGSVLREGDDVRIRVELIRARPREEQLWTQAYDRQLRDVLTLYGDVARAIAGEIELRLTPQEEQHLAGARPVNPRAYEAYLTGKQYWYRFTPAAVDTALQYFESALKIDPNYALGYQGISMVWGVRMQLGWARPSEAGPKIQEFVQKALALDSTAGETWFQLAAVRAWYEWNWAGADTAFRRSLELNPNDPRTRIFYSHFLTILKRPEKAREQAERALRLDPFNPLHHALYAGDLTNWHRYDDAIREARYALQISPGLSFALNPLANALYWKGQYPEAIVVERQIAAAAGDHEKEAALTQGYAQGGFAEAMRRAAELMVARSRVTYVAPLQVARLLLRAGDQERALEWLERAYEERDPNLPYIAVIPGWHDMRDNPRFKEVMRQIDLPH